MLTKSLICALAVTLLATITSGQESYNVTQQMCCDGVVHDKRRGLYCCGQDVYNSCEQGCCGDQVVEYPNELDDNYGCCLNSDDGLYSTFDSLTQKCCDGSIVNVLRLDKYYECCGTELYDYATHTCCGDAVVEVSPGMQCCGDEMVAIEAGSSSECCDNKIIDSDTELCCITYEYDEKSDTTISTYTVHDNEDGESKCCGNGLYDDDKEVCCSSYTSGKQNFYTLEKPEEVEEDDYAYCCGQEVIVSSKDSRTCCYNREDEATSVSYDWKTEQCCAGNMKAIDTESEVTESCCWNSQEFYNSQTDLCTAAGVKPLSSDDGQATMEDYCMPNSNSKK